MSDEPEQAQANCEVCGEQLHNGVIDATWCDDCGQLSEVRPMYSHRNGETKPPTVLGWYWIDTGDKGLITKLPSHYAVRQIPEGSRWYGPVIPPWEAQDE